MGKKEKILFYPGKWIWCKKKNPNQYVLFCKNIICNKPETGLKIKITASSHYELYLNGNFIGRGPVHGNPKWQHYDEYIFNKEETEKLFGGRNILSITILVHHTDFRVHYMLPAPPGLIAVFEINNNKFGADNSWKCFELKTWNQNVPKKGWALGPYEDYDARKEPEGWQKKIFTDSIINNWENAVLVKNSEKIWRNYQLRMTPAPGRNFISPVSIFSIYKAKSKGPEKVEEISYFHDIETLEIHPEIINEPFSLELINKNLSTYNAFTLDFGKEKIGFYEFELDAEEGTVIEVSGAECLKGNRPWIYRKRTGYSIRYICRKGKQKFTTFFWTGFRYMHIVVRNNTRNISFKKIGCLEKRVPLKLRVNFYTEDKKLFEIFNLCRYTLVTGIQELMIDCPTREQAQYWGDALFIALSLLKGYGEISYLEFYLEEFLHAPFNKEGQIYSPAHSGIKERAVLVDYSLLPPLGQHFYKEHTGFYYKPDKTFKKAMKLKKWYERHIGKSGLVEFDFEEYRKKKIINFIDHPGIGWHNFPHPGIDRDGISCPLNLFYFNFVRELAQIASEIKSPERDNLFKEAEIIKKLIRKYFYDGRVFHDTIKNGTLSSETSWQTNCLAVYFDVATEPERRKILETMLAGYDKLCRCSPYFYFYLLPALKKAGMVEDAKELIKREWGKMLECEATTTWETFSGDELDSLCHPWSTAPFLFLITL